MTRARARAIAPALAAIAAATAIWLPSVHLLYEVRVPSRADAAVAPRTRALTAGQLQFWQDPASKQKELARMRRSNAEWDFMGRTFLAWSLTELSLCEPARKEEYLRVVDGIIDETLQLERERSQYFFLMPYARARGFVQQPMRSLFVDGEIALMLAMRRLVQEKPGYRKLLVERTELITAALRRNALPVAESYPDECWMFDHAVALAALRITDTLEHTDHSRLYREWLDLARRRLIHPESGLLVSSFQTDGSMLDGPEGSSIWVVAHCLRLVDDAFARDQYRRARRELGRELFGFAWSREWPVSWRGGMDVDSGAVIPVLEVSAGGSGLALIGASSFGDETYLHQLRTTLDFAAFPKESSGRLRYCASNQVGDAALLYAEVLGPLWEQVLHKATP